MFLLQQLFKVREKSDGDIIKPFLDHMEDLRWMLIRILISVVSAMILAMCFREDLMQVIQLPLHLADPSGEMAKALRVDTVFGSFMISLKIAFYVGIIGALPFIVYFVADFVLPALTRKEKQALIPGFFVGLLFFALGALVSYFYIMPFTLKFFWDDAAKMGLTALWTWTSYISMFTWMILGFGLMCELPVIVVMMAMIKVVNFQLLSTTRPYAHSVIMVLACIVAPTPDPVTFLIMALPIMALYEACIWVVWGIERARAKKLKETESGDSH